MAHPRSHPEEPGSLPSGRGQAHEEARIHGHGGKDVREEEELPEGLLSHY